MMLLSPTYPIGSTTATLAAINNYSTLLGRNGFLSDVIQPREKERQSDKDKKWILNWLFLVSNLIVCNI